MSPQHLLGTYSHSIDDKSRVIVPAIWRPLLGNQFVLTPSILEEERLLRLYSEVEYDKLLARLEWDDDAKRGIAPDDGVGQRRLRWFLRHCASVEADASGRITVPSHLRDFASLGKQAVFIGRRSYVELWDAGMLEENQREATGSLAHYLGK